MERPVIAIMYDFDKTLCTKDMQDYGFIPSLQMHPSESGRKPTTSAAAPKWTGSSPICTR